MLWPKSHGLAAILNFRFSTFSKSHRKFIYLFNLKNLIRIWFPHYKDFFKTNCACLSLLESHFWPKMTVLSDHVTYFSELGFFYVNLLLASNLGRTWRQNRASGPRNPYLLGLMTSVIRPIVIVRIIIIIIPVDFVPSVQKYLQKTATKKFHRKLP